MHFNSFGALANHLRNNAVPGCRAQLTQSLKEISIDVQTECVKRIGHYQSTAGQFPAWARLAQATIDSKRRKGQGLNGNPDTPLYATGSFQSDISYRVDKNRLVADIGTTKQYIVFTELGTAKQPPRPVFGPSALEVLPRHVKRIQRHLVLGLRGGGLASISFANGAGYTGNITR